MLMVTCALQVYSTFADVFLPKLLVAIQRELNLSKQAGKLLSGTAS